MMETFFTLLQWLFGLGMVVAALLFYRARTRKRPDVAFLTARRLAWMFGGCLVLLIGTSVGKDAWEQNQNKVVMVNPFFTEWDLPFGAPPFDEIRSEHFLPAFREAIARHEAEIDSIANNPAEPTFENTIVAFDRSGAMLERVSGVFGLLTGAETNEELQRIDEEVSPMLSRHWDGILLDSALFRRIRLLHDSADTTLGEAERRLLDLTYRDFVRSGALLDEKQKNRLQEINGELALLRVKFGANLLDATNSYQLVLNLKDLDGMSGQFSAQAEEKAEALGYKNKAVVTLDAPSRIPFLTNASRRDLREQLYKAYADRCAAGTEFDNTQIINDMIRLRTEKAHLLGYGSYADYVLDKNMAKSSDRVYDLLDTLWEPALDRAKEELEKMRALKEKDTGDPDFQPWDWWYYAERIRQSEYAFDGETLRPYFSLENVRSGVFELSNRLYGLTFRPISLPTYHKDCQVYEVLDYDNSHLGILYLDFFPRPGKGSGAWCDTFRPQSREGGERQGPLVAVVCNFSPAVGSRPALLTVDEVTTFFHEFGHALHSFFIDVPYKGLNQVEWDFVELPSQLMENWAFREPFLQNYALHYLTNDPVSSRQVRRLRESMLFNQGFATVEYLAASYTDMDIHTLEEYVPFDVAAFETFALRNKRGLIPEIDPRYRYPYFSHIFDGGYATGYYGYIWAEVLDKDAFQAFVESGDIFDRSTARRFRKEVLSQGGMADGMTLYTRFRGHEPSREPLLKARGLWKEPPQPADSTAADSIASPEKQTDR